MLQFLVKSLRKARRQFIDNIEPPAADARRHPMMQHAVLRADDEVHIGRCRLLDIGQCGKAPPALILMRIFFEAVPVISGRF